MSAPFRTSIPPVRALVVLACLLVSACSGGGSGDGEFIPFDFTNGLVQEGSLDRANYRIAVPPQASWNGTLVVYAHGYRDRARVDLEENDVSAQSNPGGVELEQFLLSKGYAVAGSAFRDNGWVVGIATEDMANLTQYFRDRIAVPQRTIIMGVSMGSLVALKSIESMPSLYNGAIAACSVGAGATRNFDQSRAILLAYDLLFGMPESWGRPEDVNDRLDFENDVAPTIIQALQKQENLPRFEFIRLVAGIPAQDFYSGNGFLLTDLFFSTEARAELESRLGGAPVQNETHVYRLAPEEKAYLQGFGVPVDNLLGAMNALRGPAVSAEARAAFAASSDNTGAVTGPVLAMHTQVDGFVLPGNQIALQQIIAAAGKADLFTGTYTTGVGHCQFTGEQIFRAIEAMNFRLARGIPPPAELFFPESAGFLAPSYMPAPLRN